jgi:hypothetical protein
LRRAARANLSQQNFITGLLDNGITGKKDGVIAWQDQTSLSTTAGTSLRIGFIKGFGTGGANPAVFSENTDVRVAPVQPYVLIVSILPDPLRFRQPD